MLVLLIAAITTNVVTLVALVRAYLRSTEHPSPDPVVAAAIESMRPPPSASSTRRVITIEILNPIELAANRGRLAGIAGSLAPGIIRRIVYDQALRNMRRQMAQEKVVADVRLHTVQPARPEGARGKKEAEAQLVDVVEVEPEAADPLGE